MAVQRGEDPAVLLDPDRAVELTDDRLGRIPGVPGVYAAWLIGADDLRACGIDSSAGSSRLIYVGVAWAKGGLSNRLQAHVKNAMWQDLAELLACRGEILFPWWARDPQYVDLSGRYVIPETALARLGHQQVVAWQRQHLKWIWLPLDQGRAELREIERQVVREHNPLLNREHRVLRWPPPQLRDSAGSERVKARWLWQVAWAAVSEGQSVDGADWFGVRSRDLPFIDDAGYPARNGDRQILKRVRPPRRRQLEGIMKQCARRASRSIRVAIADTTTDRKSRDREFAMWWAGHAGADFLPGRSTESAIEASLCLADENSFPGPATLPDEASQRALIALVNRLLLCISAGGS